MKLSSDEKIFVGMFVAIFGTAMIIITIAALTSWQGTGTIVSGNSWNGGDLQHYFNATIQTPQGKFNEVFPCDYFKVNDTLKVSHNIFGFYISMILPTGCQP